MRSNKVQRGDYSLNRVCYQSLLIVLWLFAISLEGFSIFHSPVWHESSQLLAGLNIWRFQRFDTQEVNPPLVRSVVSLPIVLLSPNLDERKFNRPPVQRDEFARGIEFLNDNKENARFFFTVSRFTGLVFLVIAFLTCFHFSQITFGIISTWVALPLFCFSPYILGHGATIMPDVPSAAFAIASVYFFWKWLKRPEMLESFIAGIILGLTELTKFTLLIFYPMFIVMWLIYRLPEIKTLTKKYWFQQVKQMAV
ncbi:MAG: phospholipid carrier-dependent glycosyltransferase, partial [Planctomycetaceae bacterium]|nr:phospholipid carrier-dependent glycosyltransferase [Planctomycetaceae bacterium]